MIVINIKMELAQARLQRLLAAFSAKTLLTAVRFRLLNWVDENFAKKGIEERWPALAASTVMFQKRQSSSPLASWRQKVHSRQTGNEVWVGFATEIQKMAAWHHFGTGTHGTGRGWYLIEPKNKKVLAARLPGGLRASILGANVGEGSRARGGYFIFGKYVKHPGVPVRRLMPSEALARRMVLETLDGALVAAVKGNQPLIRSRGRDGGG